MPNKTFKDLMRFQKLEIVNSLVEQVCLGHSFTWSTQGVKAFSVALDEESDIQTTLPSEIRAAVVTALSACDCAPDNHQLMDFLPSLKAAA